jgi:hypothetical protein
VGCNKERERGCEEPRENGSVYECRQAIRNGAVLQRVRKYVSGAFEKQASEENEGRRGSGYECRLAMCNSAVLQREGK